MAKGLLSVCVAFILLLSFLEINVSSETDKGGFCPYPVPKVPASGFNVKFCKEDRQCSSNLKCCPIYQSSTDKIFYVCTVAWAKPINPTGTEDELGTVTSTMTATKTETQTKTETKTSMSTTTLTQTSTRVSTETRTLTSISISTQTSTSTTTLPAITSISTKVITDPHSTITKTLLDPTTITATTTKTVTLSGSTCP